MISELRLDILNKSLNLEHELSKIIKVIIRIPKADTKTLGYKSSALSFKTKADLLYDLDRISKAEYDFMILFMEIRNQFIHNLSVDSFTMICEVLDNTRINKLLKIDSEIEKLNTLHKKSPNSHTNFEDILVLAFDSLYIKLLGVISNQQKKLISELKIEKEKEVKSTLNDIYSNMLKIVQETTEEFGELWALEIEKQTGSKSDFAKILTGYINNKSIEKIIKIYPDLAD